MLDISYASRYVLFMTPTVKIQSEPVTTTEVTYAVEEYLAGTGRWVTGYGDIADLDKAKAIHSKWAAEMTNGDDFRVTKTTTVTTVEVV